MVSSNFVMYLLETIVGAWLRVLMSQIEVLWVMGTGLQNGRWGGTGECVLILDEVEYTKVYLAFAQQDLMWIWV